MIVINETYDIIKVVTLQCAINRFAYQKLVISSYNDFIYFGLMDGTNSFFVTSIMQTFASTTRITITDLTHTKSEKISGSPTSFTNSIVS